MDNLRNNIEKFKNTFWFFGSKSILIDIIDDLFYKLETMQTENELLKQNIFVAPPSKTITAEEIRNKLHSLKGTERLNGDYIQNINTNLSANNFQEITVNGVKIIALKTDGLKSIINK